MRPALIQIFSGLAVGGALTGSLLLPSRIVIPDEAPVRGSLAIQQNPAPVVVEAAPLPRPRTQAGRRSQPARSAVVVQRFRSHAAVATQTAGVTSHPSRPDGHAAPPPAPKPRPAPPPAPPPAAPVAPPPPVPPPPPQAVQAPSAPSRDRKQKKDKAKKDKDKKDKGEKGKKGGGDDEDDDEDDDHGDQGDDDGNGN